MAKGDHIYVERFQGIYAHHGIDAGDGWVIHYTANSLHDISKVQRTTIEDFAKDGEILVKDYEAFFEALKSPGCYRQKTSYQLNRILNRLKGIDLDTLDLSADAVIDRAEARIGESAFNIMFHNCEHFSSWCKTGISNSDQVNTIWKAAMTGPEFLRYRADKLLINLFEPKWPGGR